jgi:sugar phosphate isomerase/epimerase
MKFGVLGWITSDLTDVDDAMLARATAIGIKGMGAHLTVPASHIDAAEVERVSAVMAASGLEFEQLWGPYPRIIDENEEVRAAGVAGAADIARLAARLGFPASGIRPTSHNPNGDWWPHPENHSRASEDRLVRSIAEVLEVAEPLGVKIVLESHQTSTLDSAERIARVIERTDPAWVKVNIDPANFVSSLAVAFDPAPMINHLFDVLGPHADAVHVKDVTLEDRFVVHVAECLPGTGIMDIDTVLQRVAALDQPNREMYAVAEHLSPPDLIIAVQHLMDRATALGIWQR